MQILALTPDRKFTPKYVDVARELMREMAAGPMAIGDRLGTEQEISGRYEVSRVTVRQALELLEKEGYISRKRALGTFVARTIDSDVQFGLSGGRVLLVVSNEQRCHSDEDAAFCTVLRAIEQSLAQRNFSVLILSVGQNPGDDRQRLRALIAQNDLKAVLTIGPCLEPYADLFSDVPVVTSCTFYPTSFPWVGDDVALAAHHSTQHLLERGHRRIAMLCGSWIDGPAFAAFARGYLQAMHEAGVQADRSLMVHAYPGESLEQLATATLALQPSPTAIFCENARVCQSVIKAAGELKLRIPYDLSIVGYGQNVCEINEPVKITAYVPETARVGEMAVDLVRKLLSDRLLTSTPISVPGRLVERDSVRSL